MNSAIMLFNLS